MNIAAIGLGGADYARQFRDEQKIDFPLLVDEDSRVHKLAGLRKANVLHLLRRDNAVARERAKSGGYSQKKLGKDPFQLGGSFVFGPGNQDHLAHISQTFGDNATMESLLSVQT
jgi:hypothetical protein